MFLSQIRMYPNDRSIPVSTPPRSPKNPHQRYQSFTTDTSFTRNPTLLHRSSTAFSAVRARLTIFSLMEGWVGTLPFWKIFVEHGRISFLRGRFCRWWSTDPRRMTHDVCVRTHKGIIHQAVSGIRPAGCTPAHTHTRTQYACVHVYLRSPYNIRHAVLA